MHLLDAPRVVDGNDVEQRVLSPMPASQEVAADTAKAVDRDLDLLLCPHLYDTAPHGLRQCARRQLKQERMRVLSARFASDCDAPALAAWVVSPCGL